MSALSLNVKLFYWPIDRTLLGATTLGQSGPGWLIVWVLWRINLDSEPGSDGNEGVLHIPQSSSITDASPSDCLGYLLGESYLSAEMQLAYFAAPADKTITLESVSIWKKNYEASLNNFWDNIRLHKCSFFHTLQLFSFMTWK